MNEKYIGIVGGVGPHAGVELQKAILRHTDAITDQAYLPVVAVSIPHEISDRTDFLLGKTPENPAYAIIDQIKTLYSCGARIMGIPCNTAHAEEIFAVVKTGVSELKNLILVNMIDETFRELNAGQPASGPVGVLATIGSYKSNLFQKYGTLHRCKIIIPEEETIQADIHRSIYDKSFGIKALGYLDKKASESLDHAFNYFNAKNIKTLILGCTELSVVFNEAVYKDITLIDPIDVLARKLIYLYKTNPMG